MLPIDNSYITDNVDNRNVKGRKLISIVIVMFRPSKESLYCLRKVMMQVTNDVDVIVINNGDDVKLKGKIV